MITAASLSTPIGRRSVATARTRIRHVRLAVLVFELALLGQAGCLPDATPPPRGGTPASCGNGICDPGREDCESCPTDCSCCAIIAAAGIVPDGQDETLVVGEPDGETVGLAGGSALDLVFGRGLVDDPGAPDLQIVGTLLSTTSVPVVDGCAGGSGGTGGFEVLISADGTSDSWQSIGLWGRGEDGEQVDSFDIGCTQLSSIRWVRLQGQPGAAARLDAITAVTNGAGERPSCDGAAIP